MRDLEFGRDGMKKLSVLIIGTVLMSGCTTAPPTEVSATRGLLICEPNSICPIVKVKWNEQDKSTLKVDVTLENPTTSYDIQRIVFDNGQKTQSFKPTEATRQQFILSNYRSSSTILTPVNIMAELTGTDSISMQIITDKGSIRRYIYHDGQASSAYRQFIQAYPHTQ